MSVEKLPVSVEVTTTARLHMGFFDLNGDLGRRFGSIGLSLDGPSTRLLVRHDSRFTAMEPGADKALACASRFAEQAGITGGAALELASAIPEHAGLGSGTQMALAVGVALASLHGRNLTVQDVAALTSRGARSGIGIGAFQHGGLLVDGGRGAQTQVPPLLARMDFPQDWRVLLIFDQSGQGVHGSQEIAAFQELPEFPAAVAAEICRRVLMQALPAVAECDLAAFGEAIHAIQCHVGDYFAAAQGGGRYTSTAVGTVLEWLRAQGIGCVGQSSWGPTGFAVVADEAEGMRLQAELEHRFGAAGALRFVLSKARNQGSQVQVKYEK